MITLRPATLHDAIHLYVWRTHPATQTMMRETGDISWEQHLHWLRDVLEDPNRYLLIGRYGSKPIGTARLDVTENEAEISVTVAPESRGHGFGAELIAAATRWGFKTRHLTSVTARIKPENIASIKAFAKAEYEEIERNAIEVVMKCLSKNR